MPEPPLVAATPGRTLLWWARWLLLLAALVFGASLYQRVPHLDEAWIGEQAYWAAKQGVVRSELFRGLLHAEVRQLVYHWLFVWQAAGLIKLAGWSALKLKLISLSYLGLFLLLSYRHVRRHFFVSAAGCYLFYGLLLANTLLVEFSYVFRPEVMVMCLGFASWRLLQRSLHGPGGVVASALGAGALAGLAALAHLNGLIFVAAGVGLLGWHRQWRALLSFGSVATVVFSLSYVDILLHHRWPLYVGQMAPALQGQRHPWVVERLLSAAGEHKRFFHSPAESLLTLLVLAAGVVLHQAGYRQVRFLDARLYLLLLVGALACIAPGKTTKYMLLYLPFLCLVIALAFEHRPVRRPWHGPVLTGLLAGYVLVNFGFTGYLISRHEDRPAKNQLLARHLAARGYTRVLAPLDFVFPAINDFNIQGITCYKLLMEAQKIPIGAAGIFSTAARFQRQVVIMDSVSLRDMGLAQPVPGRTYGPYRHTHRFLDFYIYEALPALNSQP